MRPFLICLLSGGLMACQGAKSPSVSDPSVTPFPTEDVDDDTPDDDTPDDTIIDSEVSVADRCDEIGNLEIVPLDIWGRDLREANLTLGGRWQVVADPDASESTVLGRMDDRDEVVVARITAPDYHGVSLTLDVTPNDVAVLQVTGGAQTATTTDTRTIDGYDCPVTTVYVGLDHVWFASSGRAPSMNSADLLLDGEEYWGAVASDVLAASERVTWSTWWWQSNFELVRSTSQLGGPGRWGNTALGMLEGLSGVQSRILVTQFWADNTDLSTFVNGDDDLYAAAEDTTDNIEVIFQANHTAVPIFDVYRGVEPTFSFTERVRSNGNYAGRFSGQMPPPVTADAASWHQKSVVVDGEVAYVSGFNTKSTDWDTQDHQIFEPLRMEYGATTEERAAVANRQRLPDLGPRKDYGIRVEGPAAMDVEDVLHSRWEYARAEGAIYAGQTTPYSQGLPTSPVSAADGGVHLQVVATMPGEDPEQSILETQIKAISQANDYIYIEDQYFRAPRLNAAVINRMLEVPDLVLIVVNKPVTELDPGAHGTHASHSTFEAMFGDRYLMLQLRTSDIMLEEGWIWDNYTLVTQDMDTHSKMRLVDDRYLSVGSCNWNNRGYLYEGELNVSVLDQDFVTDARSRIFQQLAGVAAPMLTGDLQQDIALIRELAQDNQDRLDWWTDNIEDMDLDEVESRWPVEGPQGFVFPLDFPDWYVLDAGPDAF